MTFRCKSVFDFIFSFFFQQKFSITCACKAHCTNEQATAIPKLSTKSLLIITICRWNSAICVHMNWIKWTLNHLCEIRDIHIDLCKRLIRFYCILFLMKEIQRHLRHLHTFTLTSKRQIKACFAPMNRNNFAFWKSHFSISRIIKFCADFLEDFTKVQMHIDWLKLYDFLERKSWIVKWQPSVKL